MLEPAILGPFPQLHAHELLATHLGPLGCVQALVTDQTRPCELKDALASARVDLVAPGE